MLMKVASHFLIEFKTYSTKCIPYLAPILGHKPLLIGKMGHGP